MYRNIIQESIEYIEAHLKSELTVKELSERAGFSLFHYYRVFQSVVGMPVMQYILRRRLLNGIYEISCGNKMVDVAFAYGFDTYAGFYKAFLREFGRTPAQFLKTYKVKKPYGINLFQEEHRMVTHKKIAEILRNWGLEKEQISDIFYEGSGNRNDSAFYVGEQYVIKFSANMQTLKTHMELSRVLGEAGLWSALPVKTLDGKDHIAEDGLFYCLTRRLAGQQLQVGDLYEEGGMTKARYIGEVLGHLSLALEKVDVPLQEADLYETVTNWAIPKIKGKLMLPTKLQVDYREIFGRLYRTLPMQTIHRDPNPGNLILAEEKWGVIDFELSERNIRIFDPCYAATAILSESFADAEQGKKEKWIAIYQNILYGYDAVVRLTAEEKQAIPYVVLSNQLIATAWFMEQDKYRELYEINRNMTEWMAGRFEKLKIK